MCGQRSFGAAALRRCLELGHDVLGASSPAGDAVSVEAELRRVPWMPSGALSAASLPVGVDLILAAHSHDFIGRRLRDRTALGAIGYHPSLLPRHRGRDAVRWTVKMGDPIAGGSVYWLSERVDGGDIAAQDWCWVRPRDTASELWRRDLFPLGLRLLERVLRDLSAGVIVRVPQDEGVATWEPSWGREPIARPELLRLPASGAAGVPGFTVQRERAGI